MERKLASIQQVVDVQLHPNAERLDIIKVLGWNLVAKRGEFKPGDKCCYVECDAVLPDQPQFEFMRDRKFRVKTVRLRGAISQGIAFPLQFLELPADLPVGADVTERLGVKKFVHPLELTTGGDAVGGFPHFIPQTDETRIQSVPLVLDRWRGQQFTTTEKLEGCSMTVAWNDAKHYVCGRTQQLADKPNSLYWNVVHKLKIDERLASVNVGFTNIAVQGEVVGPKVQGNWYELAELDFYIFNVFDVSNHRYLPYEESRKAAKMLGLKHVPFRGFLTIEADTTVDSLVAGVSGMKSILNPNKLIEGLVVRPLVETVDLELGRLSFKVINPEYLLATGN